jgi:hypothetical protein
LVVGGGSSALHGRRALTLLSPLMSSSTCTRPQVRWIAAMHRCEDPEAREWDQARGAFPAL